MNFHQFAVWHWLIFFNSTSPSNREDDRVMASMTSDLAHVY